MNVTSPPDVASAPMYPFRYNRSRHSTSNVTCPFSSSGMLAMNEILRNSKTYARRFEVVDLARRTEHLPISACIRADRSSALTTAFQPRPECTYQNHHVRESSYSSDDRRRSGG